MDLKSYSRLISRTWMRSGLMYGHRDRSIHRDCSIHIESECQLHDMKMTRYRLHHKGVPSADKAKRLYIKNFACIVLAVHAGSLYVNATISLCAAISKVAVMWHWLGTRLWAESQSEPIVYHQCQNVLCDYPFIYYLRLSLVKFRVWMGTSTSNVANDF